MLVLQPPTERAPVRLYSGAPSEARAAAVQLKQGAAGPLQVTAQRPAGAAGFAEASPLQRIWRDSAVAARHAVVLPAVNYEVYGKALLGRDDQITPLI